MSVRNARVGPGRRWKIRLHRRYATGAKSGMMIFVPREKTKIDIAAEKIADVLIDHMEETMTPAQARAMRRDLHRLAVKSTQTARN